MSLFKCEPWNCIGKRQCVLEPIGHCVQARHHSYIYFSYEVRAGPKWRPGPGLKEIGKMADAQAHARKGELNAELKDNLKHTSSRCLQGYMSCNWFLRNRYGVHGLKQTLDKNANGAFAHTGLHLFGICLHCFCICLHGIRIGVSWFATRLQNNRCFRWVSINRFPVVLLA